MSTDKDMLTVTIDGSAMNVVVVGSGPTIILASSFLWDAEMWRPQVDALSSSFRLVIPELWGHGTSGAMPVGTADLREIARQHLVLLDRLGVEICSLVGLSAGGMWGAELALLAPERVSALALIGTSLAAEPEEARQRAMAMLDAIDESGLIPEQVREAAVPLFFSSTIRARKPELPATLDAAFQAWKPERLKDSIVPLGRLIFNRRDALQDLSRLSIPTMVMTGAEDVAQPPAVGRATAGRIGCKFVIIPEAGHIASLEAPDFVNKALKEFLGARAFS